MSIAELSSRDPWDSIAADYDKLSRPLMAKFTREALKNLKLDPTWRALDVACGPGTCSLYLSEFIDRIDAVDFSPRMISLFHKNLKDEQIENIFPKVSDGQNLPFEDQVFDLCISMFGLMFFPDRNKGFLELYRVLKPRGLAVVSSWAPVEKSSLMQIIGEAVAQSLPKRQKYGSEYPLCRKDDFAKELSLAGFRDFEIRPVYSSIRVGNISWFWQSAVKLMPPIQKLKRELNELQWDLLEEKALCFLSEKLSPDSELGSEAFVAIARKCSDS